RQYFLEQRSCRHRLRGTLRSTTTASASLQSGLQSHRTGFCQTQSAPPHARRTNLRILHQKAQRGPRHLPHEPLFKLLIPLAFSVNLTSKCSRTRVILSGVPAWAKAGWNGVEEPRGSTSDCTKPSHSEQRPHLLPQNPARRKNR